MSELPGASRRAPMWHRPRWAPTTVGRVEGMDVARALAIVGMVAAHVGHSGSRSLADGAWPWLWIADGRAAALFAILAGVSMSLMYIRRIGGNEIAPLKGDTAHTVIRVVTRGALLIAAGYALDRLGTPVDVILSNLGLMMIIATVALRWQARWLAVGAVGFVVGGRWLLERVHIDVPVLETLTSAHYPGLQWTGYVLAGMAVGKLALDQRHVHVALMGIGAPLASAMYTLGPALYDAPYLPGGDRWTSNPGSVAAHSYTVFEMMGNIGTALVVMGALAWITPRLRALLWPLIAAGSMALTLYVAHLVVIKVVGRSYVYAPTNEGMVALVAGLIVGAVVWRAVARQGPLEWVLTAVSSWTARLLGRQ